MQDTLRQTPAAVAPTPQPLPALEDGWLNHAKAVIFSTHLMGTSPVFDTFSLSTVIENMSPEWKPRFKRIALGTDLHTTVFKVCSKSYSDSKDNIAKKLFGKYGKGARMTAKQNLPLKRFAEHLFSSSSVAELNRAALLRKIRHLEQFREDRVGFWTEAHAEISRVNGLEPDAKAEYFTQLVAEDTLRFC
ncbi:hypothetical protein BDR26DRAFT_924617 [Obelidium mucronatum]|nr:hypothetical protein BDR26DRAFT_924617 [Obelidium mucronatum]